MAVGTNATIIGFAGAPLRNSALLSWGCGEPNVLDDGLRLMVMAQGWGFRQEEHESGVGSSGLAWPLLGRLLLLLRHSWLFALRILQFGKTPGDASANARGWVQVQAELLGYAQKMWKWGNNPHVSLRGSTAGII